jgi:hypothetical protein
LEPLEEILVQRDEIIETLKNGIHTVTFTKVDGTQRTMPCTLDPALLPVVELRESSTQRKTNLETLKVYVTDINQWRSFKIQNLISIS